MARRATRSVDAGFVGIGSAFPVSIQTMTNVPLADFNGAGFAYGDIVHTKISHGAEPVFEGDVLFHQSFGFAEKGAPMLYNNELMKIGMAVTQGSMERQYGIGFGNEWIVDLSKA